MLDCKNDQIMAKMNASKYKIKIKNIHMHEKVRKSVQCIHDIVFIS